MTPSPSRRSFIRGGAAAAVALPGTLWLPVRGRADGPAAAGMMLAYPRQIGEFEVTVISDGFFNLTRDLLVNISEEDAIAAFEASFLDPDAPLPQGITALLVQGQGRTILIDAGTADLFGPTAGRFGAGLATLGVAPESVDAILLTHMHPDHIGGLISDDAAAYPNAVLRVDEADLAFWTDESIAAGAPESSQPFFARARQTAALYGERVEPFSGTGEVASGISAMPLPGHTPGHTGFRIDSGDAALLMIGDATGLAPVQFRHPEAGLVFDTDPALAAESRMALLDMAATDRLLVTGTHLPFPTLGHVARSGAAYAWVPEAWQYR